MPPVDPEAKIPCPTPGHLHAELEHLTDVLTPPETEDSWEKMEKAIIRFAGITRGGGYKHVDVYVSGVGRTGIGSRLVDCMLSDRGRLSGAATDLLTALAPRLGHHFGQLIPLYLPPVVRLLARPNKIFLKRADKCLSTIITHCPLGTMLPYIGEGTVDKSEACRRACSTGLLRACEEWPKEIWGTRGVNELENCLRKIAVDKDAEVRKIGKKLWSFYNSIWPERVEEFAAPLTPTIRRYLEISATAGSSRPRAAVKARPAPPALLSSTNSTSSAHTNKAAAAPVRAQPPATRPFVAAPPARPVRAESHMTAADYAVAEQVQRTTVHRAVEAESSRPLLSRAPATMALLQGPVRPDVSKQGRSQSAAILSTLAVRETPVDLSRPVRLPAVMPPPAQTTAVQLESGSRRFAPPARLARPPSAEEMDGEHAEGNSGPLRGPARALPMGETRRQLMGQAHRRAHPGPGPSISASVPRTRPEVDLAEIAIRAAMLPLPDSPPRQQLISISLPEDAHPASPSPIRPPQPSLSASATLVSTLYHAMSANITTQPPDGSDSIAVNEDEVHVEATAPATTDLLATDPISLPNPSARQLDELATIVDARLSELATVEPRQVEIEETDGKESPVELGVVGEQSAEMEGQVSAQTRLFPAPQAGGPLIPAKAPPLKPERAVAPIVRPAPTSSLAAGASFKPKVAGRAPASGSRQPFKPTPSPSVVAATTTKRPAATVAARTVSASSAAGPSRPIASTSRTSPAKPMTVSRPPSVTGGRSVSASAAALTSRPASPSKASLRSSGSAHVPKPPIPPNRREPAKPTHSASATTALKRSASSKPAMAPPPVPAVRKERVRLKAPLPSFVPRKPAGVGVQKANKVQPEAVPLPASPEKGRQPTSIPLPASPVHVEAIAIPLPPSPERPSSRQSVRVLTPTHHLHATLSRPASQASSSAPSLQSSVTASAVNSQSHPSVSDEAGETKGVTFQPSRTSSQAFVSEAELGVGTHPKEGDLLHLAADEPGLSKTSMPMTPGRALAIKLGFIEGPATPGTPMMRQALGDKDPNIVESDLNLLF